ncbi:hypothetical protein [Cellulomonas soli]
MPSSAHASTLTATKSDGTRPAAGASTCGERLARTSSGSPSSASTCGARQSAVAATCATGVGAVSAFDVVQAAHDASPAATTIPPAITE